MIKIRKQSWEISLISFLILSLELAFIRLIPAEIKAISYFTNLLLFSSFFGLGVGCLFQSKRSLEVLFPLGTFFVFLFAFFCRGIVVYETGKATHYWLQAMDQRSAPFLQLPLFLVALIVFILSSIPFMTLGQALTRKMDQHERLKAYSWDILGSLLGTISFTLFAFLGMPPWVWIVVGSVIWGFYVSSAWPNRVAHIIAGFCYLCLAIAPHSWKWSPYYFIQYELSTQNLTVWVNSSFHQEAIHFDNPDPNFKSINQLMLEKFGLPYSVYKKHHAHQSPKNVLILGAGTGNDVNIALKNGAEKVTAVEIDPVIASLGRELNSMHPYQDPRVQVIVDDGRHFLWNTKDKYDLIVFGTLDSQTLLSGQANLRLENYIYTVECFQDVKKALNEQGMMAAYYSVFKDWFYGRIYSTVHEAFPDSMMLYRSSNSFLFNSIIVAGQGIPDFKTDPKQADLFKEELPSIDDWPYIYLEHPTLSPLYLGLLGSISLLILGVFICLKRSAVKEKVKLHFFFLGVGFTLLEAASIVRLALVFGTTWIVNAFVFSAALLTIFLSNLLVLKKRAPSLSVAWIGLIGFIGLNYAFPVQLFFGLNYPLRILSSILLVGIPLGFAGICFSRLFAREEKTGFALGVNLIGAMGGGLLEYFSMMIGMRDVWLLILVVYLLAYAASIRLFSQVRGVS